jgi:hypothetical protein
MQHVYEVERSKRLLQIWEKLLIASKLDRFATVDDTCTMLPFERLVLLLMPVI